MNQDKSKLVIVTEVGHFGGLNIEDPTIKEVNKVNPDGGVDIDEIVRKAKEEMKNNKE